MNNNKKKMTSTHIPTESYWAKVVTEYNLISISQVPQLKYSSTTSAFNFNRTTSSSSSYKTKGDQEVATHAEWLLSPLKFKHVLSVPRNLRSSRRVDQSRDRADVRSRETKTPANGESCANGSSYGNMGVPGNAAAAAAEKMVKTAPKEMARRNLTERLENERGRTRIRVIGDSSGWFRSDPPSPRTSPTKRYIRTNSEREREREREREEFIDSYCIDEEWNYVRI